MFFFVSIIVKLRNWNFDSGCWLLVAGFWMLDAGCSILDAGSSTAEIPTCRYRRQMFLAGMMVFRD